MQGVNADFIVRSRTVEFAASVASMRPALLRRKIEAAFTAARKNGQEHLLLIRERLGGERKKAFELQVLSIYEQLGGKAGNGFVNLARWTRGCFPTAAELQDCGGDFNQWRAVKKRQELALQGATLEREVMPDINGFRCLMSNRSPVTDMNLGRGKRLYIFVIAGGEGTRLGSNLPKHLYPISEFRVSPLENLIDFLSTEFRGKDAKVKVGISVSRYSHQFVADLLDRKAEATSILDFELYESVGVPVLDFYGKIVVDENDKILFGGGGPGSAIWQNLLAVEPPSFDYVLFLDGQDFSIPENMGVVYELIGRIDRLNAKAGTTIMRDQGGVFGRMFMDAAQRVRNVELADVERKDASAASLLPDWANADHVVLRADYLREVIQREVQLCFQDRGTVPDFRFVTRRTSMGSGVRVEKGGIDLLLKYAGPLEFLVLPAKEKILITRDPASAAAIADRKYALFRDFLRDRGAEVSETAKVWINPLASNLILGQDADIEGGVTLRLAGSNLQIGEHFVLERDASFVIEDEGAEHSASVRIGSHFSVGSGAVVRIILHPGSFVEIEDGITVMPGAAVNIVVPPNTKVLVGDSQAITAQDAQVVVSLPPANIKSRLLEWVGHHVQEAGRPEVLAGVHLFSDDPALRNQLFTRNLTGGGLPLVWAQGNLFVDASGKVFLDFSSQTQNLNLGNNHPALLSAVRTFVDSGQPFYTSSRFCNASTVKLASALLGLLPADLNRINLKILDGSDATETAVKIAIQYHALSGRPERKRILSLDWSHHGETIETMALSPKHSGFAYVDTANHTYLPPNDLQAFQRAVAGSKQDVALFILEPVQVNGGMIPMDQEYLRQVRKICSAEDIVLAFDEVQTAFGWTGGLFALEHYGVCPDVLCLAKGLASGFPLAATVLKEKYDVLDFGEAEFTGGMNPMSAEVALANLRILTQTDILRQVPQKGEKIRSGLLDLQRRFPGFIREVRGMGLMWGMEMDAPQRAKAVFRDALEQGVLFRVSKDGDGETVLLKPSLVVTEPEIEKALEVLENGVTSFSRRG